jgi:eukaryotic-like serine/threonine-protein kinase
LGSTSNCPTWDELLVSIRKQAEVKGQTLDHLGQQLTKSQIAIADNTSNYWEKFSILRKALGDSTYPMAIRESFALQAKAAPKFYTEMWKLGIQGFITTNIDRFAVKSIISPELRSQVVEFDGKDSAQHAYLLRTQAPFVLNIHGRLESDTSWVFTAEELSALMSLTEYWTLLESFFRNAFVLFAGCSPNDPSVAAHLERLKASKLRLESHFWLTHKNDYTSSQWAENHNLSRIFFDASDNSFEGIDEFISELKNFQARDQDPPIVIPPTNLECEHRESPTPEALLIEPSVNRIREVLNAEAKRILTSSQPHSERVEEYERFTSTYEEALHRAWFVSTNRGAEFFDLQIYKTLKKGAFGQVYEAIDPKGNHVALKVLHGNVKDDPTMLTCFRRGVDAMRLLAEEKVDGVVPYIRAWEIPTCAVMDLIDGVNLQEAIERGQLQSWSEILHVASTLASIIKAAHFTPAGVLHRDLRPPNIMLDSPEDKPGRKVLVLDFDLCWHQDAIEGSSLRLGAEQNNGYLAPEQLDANRSHLTRKPLVDSFGLGMVLFFLLARKAPEINQYMFRDWWSTLERLASERKCPQWRSVPRRFIRIVYNATLDEQSSRWDMTKIVGELAFLQDLVKGRRKAVTVEALVEEIVVRVCGDAGVYSWEPDRCQAAIRPREGFEVTLKWIERDRKALLQIAWLQTGNYRFEALKKYMDEAADCARKALRISKWEEVKHVFGTGALNIEAYLPLSVTYNEASLEQAAGGLASAVQELRILGSKN